MGVNSVGMTIRNSEVRATTDGVGAQGVTIIGSKVSGGRSSLLTDRNAKASFSELNGPVNPAYGTGMKCYAVHDQDYNSVTCP
jgi:hypothetical protein